MDRDGTEIVEMAEMGSRAVTGTEMAMPHEEAGTEMPEEETTETFKTETGPEERERGGLLEEAEGKETGDSGDGKKETETAETALPRFVIGNEREKIENRMEDGATSGVTEIVARVTPGVIEIAGMAALVPQVQMGGGLLGSRGVL
mmetsp:Transcript_17767/g.36110  ORF Transcript_17767/g.36110 Transcript_17767/m.36110 type:complete len:146 (+) Transcript_17767:462-899(+)